ncbi:DUF1499 domain-containing protein [Bacillus sp. FJAT-45037]|uniref:DUF1499 domain-containing protein n=1 Tax=Bacillus sp. FJAT-45037 TaxID=2011007 RepID=UPI000C2462D8|nr:DUF1499 domain-containing protein [Bacillus sp. FJAT-45037]
MGILDKIKQLTSTRAETSESHADKQMRTHYYKISRDKAIDAVDQVIQAAGWKIKKIEKERGEIIAYPTTNNKSILIVTIVTVKPFRTAIDFACSSDTMLPTDFGKSKKTVIHLYELINKEIPYIGSGIGEELL